MDEGTGLMLLTLSSQLSASRFGCGGAILVQVAIPSDRNRSIGDLYGYAEEVSLLLPSSWSVYGIHYFVSLDPCKLAS